MSDTTQFSTILLLLPQKRTTIMGIVANIYFLGGIIMGTGATLAFIARSYMIQKRKDLELHKLPKFYLNLTIMNKKEVIGKAIDKKISHGPFGVRRRIVKSIAKSKVSDEDFTRKIVSKLSAGIPKKFLLKGITAIAKVCFIKGCYGVVEVTIESVDVDKILGSKLDEKKMSMLNSLFDLLDKVGIRSSAEFALNTTITQKMQSKMVEIMGGEISKKLRDEGGVDAHVEAKSAADQIAYFFSMVGEDADKKAGE